MNPKKVIITFFGQKFLLKMVMKILNFEMQKFFRKFQMLNANRAVIFDKAKAS